MLKKSVGLLMTLGLSLLVTTAPADATELYFNKSKLELPSPVIFKSVNDTLVPVSVIANLLGLSYEYQPAVKTITLRKNENTLVFTVGKNYYSKNGTNINLSSVPTIYNNYVYLPLQPVIDFFGLKLEYDTTTDKMTIKNQDWEYLNALLWEKNLEKSSYGEMVRTSDGILIPQGNKLLKVDSEGNTLWTLTLGNQGKTPEQDQVVGTPHISPDGSIYVTTSDFQNGNNFERYVYKISNTGEVEWKVSYLTNYEGYNQPIEVTTDSKNVYVTQKDLIMCFDHSGVKRWQSQPRGYLQTKTIAINNKINTHKNYSIYLDTNPANLVKLDQKGKILWKTSLLAAGTPEYLVYEDSTGFALTTQKTTDQKNLISLYDIFEEEWKWNKMIDGELISEPIFEDGNILIATNQKIEVLNKKGEIIWQQAFENLSSIKLGTNAIGAATDDGKFIKISLDGKVQQILPLNRKIADMIEVSPNNWLFVTGDKQLISLKIN